MKRRFRHIVTEGTTTHRQSLVTRLDFEVSSVDPVILKKRFYGLAFSSPSRRPDGCNRYAHGRLPRTDHRRSIQRNRGNVIELLDEFQWFVHVVIRFFFGGFVLVHRIEFHVVNLIRRIVRVLVGIIVGVIRRSGDA